MLDKKLILGIMKIFFTIIVFTTIFSIKTSFSYSISSTDNDLIAVYSFNNSETFIDLKNGYNLLATKEGVGGVYNFTNGINGIALECNATDDANGIYLRNTNIDNSIGTGNRSYAISLWFKYKSYIAYDYFIGIGSFAGGGSGAKNNNAGIGMYSNSNAWRWNYYNEDNSGVSLNHVYWVNIIQNFDGQRTTFYVNGTLTAINESDAMIFNNDASAGILICGQLGSNYLNGILDEIYIFNRSLSYSEISQLSINSTTAFYPFETTTPSTDYFYFYGQYPADITTTNLIGNNIQINYTINFTPSLSTVKLNYTINSTYGNGSYWVVVNETVDKSGWITDDFSLGILTGLGGSPDIYYFTSDGDNLLPATYNIDEDVMKNTTHDTIFLTGINDYALTTLKNVSNLVSNGLLEVMLNSSGTCEIYYCNSSYTTGLVTGSTNCVQFGSSNSSGYNHSHSTKSKHNIYPFPVNITSKKISTVSVTDTSYFLVRGSSSGSGCALGTVNITTTPTTTKTTNNGGNTWSNQLYTIDSHLHQFSNSDTFLYKACAGNSTYYNCSTVRSDTFDITLFPPTTPQLYTLDNETAITRQAMINWTNAIPYYNGTILYYNLTITNISSTTGKLLYSGTNTTYFFNIFYENITAGYYAFDVLAFDTNGLSSRETSQYILIEKNAIINISVFNDTSKVYNYTINVSYNGSVIGVLNSSQAYNGSVDYDVINNNTYELLLDAEGFSYVRINVTINNTLMNYSIFTNPNNAINITIRDETTNLLVTQNVTVLLSLTGTTTTYTYTTDKGYLLVSGVLAGNYTIRLTSLTPTVYNVRTYNAYVSNRSYQTLEAYLNAGGDVLFTVTDSLTNAILEGVTFNMYRIINGSWSLVEAKYTDITGRVQFSFTDGIAYQFILSYTGYNTRNFTLNPILFTSYNVKMEKNSLTPSGFSDVTLYWNNTRFYDNRNNSIFWSISSPSGLLTSYNYCIIYNVNSSECYSGSNLYGGSDTSIFFIENSNYLSKVLLNIFYTTSTGNNYTFNYTYPIILLSTNTNYTFINIGSRDYGLGLLEKIIIVTLVTIVIVGIGGLLGGQLIALGLGLFIFGYFVLTGFIPFWIIALPVIIGFMILFSGGRNNG